MSTHIHNGRLSVPLPIQRSVPHDAMFEAQLTDEGILFRFVGLVPRVKETGLPPSQLPAWAKESQ